jgi:hypothetical protein
MKILQSVEEVKMNVQKWQTEDGQIFDNSMSAWDHEIWTEKEKLKADIEEAYYSALHPHPMMIDTFGGGGHGRAIYYMKGVCERFVEKHKESRMA